MHIDLKEVENAVREETEGPGQLLGYRALQRKLREQHNLAVPRALVYDVMGIVDPEGLERRGNVGQKRRRRGATGTFTSLLYVSAGFKSYTFRKVLHHIFCKIRFQGLIIFPFWVSYSFISTVRHIDTHKQPLITVAYKPYRSGKDEKTACAKHGGLRERWATYVDLNFISEWISYENDRPWVGPSFS
ncbi:hypothetical protein QZH41_017518 [Actinostola sp. cb2023]|nr:hypothetical protein QZH41_017518 [Actinostola sp. cb2023]